jgi:uncharacterized membrane protein
MAVGPVQLVVLGFSNPEFHGEIVAELQKLRESDTVRVIDALAVYKDGEGNVEVKQFSNLSDDERGELGTKVGALLGLGVGGIEGAEIGAEAGAQASASGANFFNEDEAWDAVGEIPPNTAAALLLLEHHWAVGLRDAVYAAGGFPINSAFITPLDLVAIGLLSQAEAEAEMGAATTA